MCSVCSLCVLCVLCVTKRHTRVWRVYTCHTRIHVSYAYRHVSCHVYIKSCVLCDTCHTRHTRVWLIHMCDIFVLFRGAGGYAICYIECIASLCMTGVRWEWLPWHVSAYVTRLIEYAVCYIECVASLRMRCNAKMQKLHLCVWVSWHAWVSWHVCAVTHSCVWYDSLGICVSSSSVRDKGTFLYKSDTMGYEWHISASVNDKEPYKRDYILQKRPIILRSLLIVATPYEWHTQHLWVVHHKVTLWVTHHSRVILWVTHHYVRVILWVTHHSICGW